MATSIPSTSASTRSGEPLASRHLLSLSLLCCVPVCWPTGQDSVSLTTIPSSSILSVYRHDESGYVVVLCYACMVTRVSLSVSLLAYSFSLGLHSCCETSRGCRDLPIIPATCAAAALSDVLMFLAVPVPGNGNLSLAASSPALA